MSRTDDSSRDDAERAAPSRTLFRRIFAAEPEGVWAAPGRVNLIGEHTDYNDGFVMPFALPQSTYVAARRREDGQVRVHSLFADETVEFAVEALRPGAVEGWAGYVAGMIWSLRTAADVGLTLEGSGDGADGGSDAGGAAPVLGGVDLLIDSTVPHGAGLSSSAALECSVGLAVAELHSVSAEPLTLARLAQRAENDFVGMPCGLMDQMISMLGEPARAVLFDTRSLTPRPVAVGDPAEVEVLVVDTRAPHRLVDGEYAARRSQCERAAAQLGVASLRELSDRDEPVEESLAGLDDELLRRRARHVITENRRVLEAVDLLAAGDVASAGERMTASHRSLRDDYEVTVPETDVAVEALLDAGAHGARITGGGFGGCVVALAPAGMLDRVRSAVRERYAAAGFGEPEVFAASPSAGARRVR
ncbi:galactokinase [Nesterenkonia sp. F]|uniref:galactokinase n=1 Tax=Nesterenkonia sp. F TaxID=795955 RepID=UPI000255CE51|nr:galactokinase [Nesterenkonia sp. F]